MLDFNQVKILITNLEQKLKALKSTLDINSILSKINVLENQTLKPDFWNNKENSAKILTEIKNLQNTVSELKKIESDISEVKTIIEILIEENDPSYEKEVNENLTLIEKKLESMYLSTLLNGPYDKNNAILTFHAGAGGTDAQDWTQILYRLYHRWATSKNFKIETLNIIEGDEAGIKSATITIKGFNAYGFLKSETGVHRLVRISPFNSSSQRHTSFASVEVIPEIEEENSINIEDEDLKIETFRAGGAGGQHVNKTESAVRITHLPTNIIVSCQNERSQLQNKNICLKILKSKLMEIKQKENLEKIEDIKGEQRKITWGSQIRSYIFMPYTLVKDHRTNFESYNVNAVIDGDIDDFINAFLKDNNQKNN